MPLTQGSRLTAFELAFEGIPSCLICDSMAGALMNGKGKVGRVVHGRITNQIRIMNHF